jgi:phenylpyruvate tautomerase PptA (4-oxalocrotonate tautomerase family)
LGRFGASAVRAAEGLVRQGSIPVDRAHLPSARPRDAALAEGARPWPTQGMPIVDVELVRADEQQAAPVSAAALASSLGAVFGSPPGRTWVRVRFLPASAYAENDCEADADQLPVFVTVLLAHWPAGEALAEQCRQVTQAVANCLSCPAERVHVQYAPKAAGRQAFGGHLVS